MQHAAPKRTQATIASALIISMVLQPVAAWAASTDLTNVPLVVQSQVQPNVLYMLDNSGSMAWGSITGADIEAEYTNGAKNMRAYYSPTYNQLYYNPATTYLPGVKYDATATASNFTTSMGNSVSTTALVDPYLAPAPSGAKVDLTRMCFSTASITLPLFDSAPFANNSNCVIPSSGSKTTLYAQYAFYYKWKGTGTEDGSTAQNLDSNYTRVEIIPATALYARAATRTDCGTGANCTYAQEIQNFANWFTYYRTRLQAAKSSLGIAFSVLDNKSRVGFATINDDNGNTNTTARNFVALSSFNTSQMSTWYSELYAVTPKGGTPLVDALNRAGTYYQTGKMQGTSTTRAQTVPLACTPNYTILSTDGYWNGSDPTSGTTQDRKVPTLPANVYVNPDTGATVNDPIAGVPLVAAQNFPAPFYDGGLSGSRNTLADVAMKYWISDLNAPSAGKVAANPSDPATWQHMVTYTIGLGAKGTLTAPPTGSSFWPAPTADDPTTIDDLWHAALNGHGQYFNTKDPVRLQTALSAILNDIVSRTGSAASLAVSNPNVEAGDNNAYASSFSSGTWAGDLQAFTIDTTTGQLASTPNWSAQAKLDVKPLGTRYIASYDGTLGVPFTATGLAARLGRFNSPTSPPGPIDGAAVINYLRGDRTGEGNGSNPAQPYRLRARLLGDIVDAEPAYIPAPRASYTDAGYTAFKANLTVANRTKVVYQAANDGMLHAFNAVTGDEMWAYVPSALVNTNLSTTYSSTSSLVGLTQQELFQHRFYVDGTPIATDIDLSNTAAFQPPNPASANWITLLVGGLAKGGRGYYALNVTNPAADSDATVASMVMWEFPNANTAATDAANIGYTYGIPLNVKTKAAGWVTLVTSGYNNGADTGGDGTGHLYVLNPDRGTIIKDLSTGVGSSANPSGLAKISAFLVNPGVDDTADFVYGGDLLGNVWRFDLTGTSTSTWNVKKVATLVDKNGVAQPITGSPELGLVNGKRMVYVGTGQYLGATDIPGAAGANASATQGQSFYGLMDDLSSTPTISPLRLNLVAQAATVAGTNINVTTNPVNLATKRGWVLDFPTSPVGERSYTSPVLFQGVLAFTTNIPSSDQCTPGGSSNLYFLNYANGGAIPNLASRFVGKVLSSRVQPEGLPGGAVKILVRTSDGGTRVFGVTVPSSTEPARVMWREVTRN
ncbi:PilC/PilY family type IV pilus protein [Variovorax sp. J22R133]|uniref:PilC/PilY family type IV pilus protein n=1 Tax=Variovorax brevis TaxID=3053503 RepID=UPI002578393B|nr:PilC/PilY family type IV pilus protein [Variovorax sp. J22R133]MDM0115271.1 PilC/PilY family type IV pilus protein [Variovorax sp. J22R133]